MQYESNIKIDVKTTFRPTLNKTNLKMLQIVAPSSLVLTKLGPAQFSFFSCDSSSMRSNICRLVCRSVTSNSPMHITAQFMHFLTVVSYNTNVGIIDCKCIGLCNNAYVGLISKTRSKDNEQQQMIKLLVMIAYPVLSLCL